MEKKYTCSVCSVFNKTVVCSAVGNSPPHSCPYSLGDFVWVEERAAQPQDSADVSELITPRKLAKRIRRTGEKITLGNDG